MDTKLLGVGLHWNEMSVGDKFKTVGRTINTADLTAFVGVTGMTEVLFTNVEYIDNETDFSGKRLLPGALVFSVAEGLLIQSMLQMTGVAFMGMEFEVNGPTFADDTIHVECEVITARATKSPARGLVKTRNRVVNQRGVTVLTYSPVRLVKSLP